MGLAVSSPQTGICTGVRGLHLLLFIQIFVRNIVLWHLMRAHFSLVRVLSVLDRLSLRRPQTGFLPRSTPRRCLNPLPLSEIVPANLPIDGLKTPRLNTALSSVKRSGSPALPLC